METPTMETIPPNPTQTASPAAGTNCNFWSCNFVGTNVSRMTCYAPACDQVFHLFFYDIAILCRHGLLHFNTAQPVHPFLHVACKKECYMKATRHFANMSADPDDRNIPWNQDSGSGENDRKISLLPGFNFQAIMPSSVPRLAERLRWPYVKKFLTRSSKPVP
jgi:hypothetical protein